MKHILIYNMSSLFNFSPIKKYFETIEELNKFLTKVNINENDILYMGKNEPLKLIRKIEAGEE